MDSRELVDELRRRYGEPNNRLLAEHLGVSYETINKWHSISHQLTVKQVSNLVDKAKTRGAVEARQSIVRPIVEYYPIDLSESKQGAFWELFDADVTGNKRQEGLKSVLKESNGVYVFYDSRGMPLYVGKAKDQSLWNEMKIAFNRDRQTQKIRSVSHPVTGTGFRPAFESPRKIEWLHMHLSGLASYFSAYEAHVDMINTVEALLIRAFANGLLNSRMETF
ncbi:hypothetical protein [Vreelandella sulfidaeris]|uniref:hypothetical protein n=1 Tax=Vreelandella sulfidaeris TaxID=115553 RepID=UPI0035E581AE